MFSQGDAALAFFDHVADYKDALTPVLADKLESLTLSMVTKDSMFHVNRRQGSSRPASVDWSSDQQLA